MEETLRPLILTHMILKYIAKKKQKKSWIEVYNLKSPFCEILLMLWKYLVFMTLDKIQ